MHSISRRLRGTLTLPAGVLAVHQLRYVLAYGSGAGHALRSHGDTYVGAAVPLVALLLAAASIVALAGLARAWRGGEPPPGARGGWWRTWSTVTLALIAGFVVLELAEIALESEHPGPASIFGDGGWWALPAAAAVGALFTLMVRGGRALLRVVAAGRRSARVALGGRARRPALPVRRARPAVLSSCAAGRAPPARRPPAAGLAAS